jgi:hypothetical protein
MTSERSSLLICSLLMTDISYLLTLDNKTHPRIALLVGQRSAKLVPPLRHSTARFGREILFENRGGKSRLPRTAYGEIRDACAEGIGQEGIKSLIKSRTQGRRYGLSPHTIWRKIQSKARDPGAVAGVLVRARIERNQSKGARYPGLVLATRPGRLSLTRKVRHLPLCFSFVG